MNTEGCFKAFTAQLKNKIKENDNRMVKHVEIVWYHFLSVGSSVAFLISSLFFYKCKSTPFFF